MSVDAVADIHVEDIEYLRHPSGPLLARIYRPKEGRPRAALVSMHGGRWTRETRLTNTVIDEALARDGALVMALDIRMPPVAGYPDCLADINYAIRWLKVYARMLGVAADHIGGMGTSSGGHQMTLSALRPHDPRYTSIRGPEGVDASLAFLVAGWPVLDPLARYRMAKAQGNEEMLSAHHAYWPDEAAQAEGNPQMILDRGEPVELPPALVVQGTADVVLPDGMADKFAAMTLSPLAIPGDSMHQRTTKLLENSVAESHLSRARTTPRQVACARIWRPSRLPMLLHSSRGESMTTTCRSALAALLLATGISVAAAQGAPADKGAKGVWEPINYPEDLKLTDVFFVTADVGWVSGAAGTMLHTKDGGKTWEAQLGGDPAAADPDIQRLRFFDERHGWAIKGEKLLATKDGANWEEIAPKLERMGDFVFVSPTEGFAVAGETQYLHEPHSIFRTQDGGRTWKQGPTCGVKAVVDGLTKQVPCYLNRFHFPTRSVGYAIAEATCMGSCGPPIMGKTEDGGETWRFFVGPGDVKVAALTDLFFTGERTGFVTSSEKKLYSTSDGGATWRGVVATPGTELKFADPETGWSFGYQHLAFTTNAGARWSSRPHRFPATVHGLSFPRRDRAYVVGDHGMIMRYRVLAPVEQPPSGALAAPAMPPFVTPLEEEAAELLAVVESLQEASGGAATGAAPAGAARVDKASEDVAMEEGEESAALPPQEGEEGEEEEGEVTEEDAGPAAGAPLAPLAPAKVGKLDLLITALSQTVPSFLDQFTNLNLLAARLRSAGDLPGRLSELKVAIAAVKKAPDNSAVQAALAQALTAAQGMHAAAAVATQRRLPPAGAAAPAASTGSPAGATQADEDEGAAAEEEEEVTQVPAKEAAEEADSDDGLAAEAARAAEEEAKKQAKEKAGKSIKKKLRF